MNEREHQLQKLNFDIDFFSESESFRFQRNFEDLLQNKLLQIIEEVLNEIDVQHSVIKIKKVEINLGEIPFNELEKKLPRILRNELLAKLKGVLSEVIKIPSENNKIIPSAVSEIDSFFFFLENGSLPWWSQSNITASVSIAVLFQKILDNQSNILIQRLRYFLKEKRLRIRLIRQLPHKILLKLFDKIAGKKTVILWNDLNNISTADRALDSLISEELIMLYMLDICLYKANTDIYTENIINDFVFFLSTNISLSQAELTNYLKRVAERVQTPLSTGFQYLERLVVSETTEENRGISEAIQSIENYLLGDAVINKKVFEQSWQFIFSNYKENFKILYRRIWKFETVKKETINLPDEKLIQIVEVIEPSNAQYIVKYAQDVQTIEKRQQVAQVGEKQFRDSTWGFILEYLLVDRGSVFNKKSFLKSFLYKTAESLGIDISLLILSLSEAVEVLLVSTELKNDIPLLLKEIQQDIFSDKQQRLRPEAYFEETFRHYQTHDILEFFLLNGALPVTADGTPPDFVGLEAMLWQYIAKNKKQLENVLGNLLAKRKTEVTKRIKEQLSPELSEAIQSTYQHLFEKNIEEPEQDKQSEISEFTHQLIYFLERGVLLSKDFKTPEEFVATFAKQFKEELDMLIQRFPKETFQRVLDYLDEPQRKIFRRKSFALTAKERWNQTSPILKEALLKWLTTGKESKIFSLHLLEETARDYLEVEVASFEKAFKKGLKNKVIRQGWAKKLSESTLLRWAHFYKSYDFKELHQTSRKLIENLKNVGFSKSRLLDFKTMQWEFIFEVQSREMGTLNLYSLTQLFLDYIKERFSIPRSFSEIDFIEGLKEQSVTIAAKDQLIRLQSDVLEELEGAERQNLRAKQLGRTIQQQKQDALEQELIQLKEILQQQREKVRKKGEVQRNLQELAAQKSLLEKKIAQLIILYQKEGEENKALLQALIAELFEDNLFVNLFSLVQGELFKKGQRLSKQITLLYELQTELAELIETSGFMASQIVQQIVADLLTQVENTQLEDIEKALQQKYIDTPKKEIIAKAILEKLIREYAIQSFVKLRQNNPSLQQLIEMLIAQKVSATVIAKEVISWFTNKIVDKTMQQLPSAPSLVGKKWREEGIKSVEIEGKPLVYYLTDELQNLITKTREDTPTLNRFLQEIKAVQTQKELPIDKNIVKKVEVELPLQEKRLQERLEQIAKTEQSIKEKEEEVKAKQKEIEKMKQQEEQAKKQEDAPASKIEPIYVNNAGLVVIHPYLKVLFQRLKLTEDNQFISQETAHRAVYILQYVANKTENAPEHELALNKFLCGIDFSEPIETEVELTENEKNTCDEMLKAVITQWDAIKNTTPDGVRVSFFQREGRLSNEMDGWYLRVSSRAYDILLDRLPWSYSLFKLPWMSSFLKVEWR